MRHLLTLLLLASTLTFAETATPLNIIANANFEKISKDGTCSYWTSNAVPCKDNPHEGAVCIQQKSSGSTWDVVMHQTLMPVKPNTTYRIAVWNRNTITGGWAKFGVRLCDKANETMRILGRVGYDWCSVKPGQSEWKRYSMTFDTAAETAYINVYFYVNKPIGDIFWDDVTLEELH